MKIISNIITRLIIVIIVGIVAMWPLGFSCPAAAQSSGSAPVRPFNRLVIGVDPTDTNAGNLPKISEMLFAWLGQMQESSFTELRFVTIDEVPREVLVIPTDEMVATDQQKLQTLLTQKLADPQRGASGGHNGTDVVTAFEEMVRIAHQAPAPAQAWFLTFSDLRVEGMLLPSGKRQHFRPLSDFDFSQLGGMNAECFFVYDPVVKALDKVPAVRKSGVILHNAVESEKITLPVPRPPHIETGNNAPRFFAVLLGFAAFMLAGIFLVAYRLRDLGGAEDYEDGAEEGA